jgi:AraC-like DNA-binding protein
LLSREAMSAEPGARALTQQLGGALFCLVLRWQMQAQDVPITCADAPIDPEVARAAAIMARQPEQNWTVERLAQEVGLSRSALAERFKQCTEQTPMQFLLDRRMHKAVKLLDSQQLVIKEVARQVGYTSTAAFSHAFKRWSGTAPGRYRRVDAGDSQSTTEPQPR